MSLPFLGYLTVFRSRLGAQNLVVDAAGSVAQDRVQIERKLARAIAAERSIDTASEEGRRVLSYLIEKGFLGRQAQTEGRYRGLVASGHDTVEDREGRVVANLKTSVVDCWLAEPCVRSTVGAPTAPNLPELVAFGQQLGLISSSKNSQTPLGFMMSRLRATSEDGTDNPFCLGLELLALTRALSAADGAILWKMATALSDRKTIARDELQMQIHTFYRQAYEDLRIANADVQLRKQARELSETIEEAVARAVSLKAASKTKAVGVLEHRTAPRLEWLTDLGALSKEGPRNVFSYNVTSDCALLASVVKSAEGAARPHEVIALEYFRGATVSAKLREQFRFASLRDALVWSYKTLSRPIGPAPIAEVALLGAAVTWPKTITVDAAFDEIIEWARSDPAIKVSGSRYVKSPELMHIDSRRLEKMA